MGKSRVCFEGLVNWGCLGDIQVGRDEEAAGFWSS